MSTKLGDSGPTKKADAEEKKRACNLAVLHERHNDLDDLPLQSSSKEAMVRVMIEITEKKGDLDLQQMSQE